jgi:protein-tyrosine-phosphatase
VSAALEIALPTSVLFACNHNAVRSPMAEGLAKHYYGHAIYFDSVGLLSQEVNGYAISVMAEIGIDISNHKGKTFDQLHDTSFDLIITMTTQAQHLALDLTRSISMEVEYWPTYDPTAVRGQREDILKEYRISRDYLIDKVKQRFQAAGIRD